MNKIIKPVSLILGISIILAFAYTIPTHASTPYMELVVVNQGQVLYENDNVSGQVTIQSISGQLCVTDFPHFGCYPINSQVNEYPKP